MDEPGSESSRSLRGAIEELLLAGVGAAAITKERADELADELASRGKVSRAEARSLVDDAVARWRDESGRMGERASMSLASLYREAGLVTRRDYEELELRLAQLEHRLRLLEQPK
jgi:polyhydroxyalkanoate synthesis regulator phasin